MSSPLACVMCGLDPQTTSLILPLAQATIVAAPVILRGEIRKGVEALRARRSNRRASSGSPGSCATGPAPKVRVDR
jgi:hypothetical protein